MHDDPAHVFVIGLDEHNREVLDLVEDPDRYDFRGVLTIEELQRGDEIPIEDLLDRAEQQIRDADVPPDAVVGWWDFPVSLMVPILGDRLGLRTPSLNAALRCEHKWWSRQVQAEVVDCHPAFAVVDPDADDPDPPLPYPFWLKPVKSFSSELAFRIEDDEGFAEALEEIRGDVDRVGEPFERIMELGDVPPDIREAGGSACIAESVMTGDQCTVEGWVHDGEVHVHGIVDSITHPGSPSFLRFEAPSALPEDVQEEMIEATRTVIGHVGLDHTTFNVEFFSGPDGIGLLEVNPRHSQSHAPLFHALHGVVTHRVQVDLALGRRPEIPEGAGEQQVAAKWFLRCVEDGEVTRVPSAEEIAAVEARHPTTTVELAVSEGDQLSELHDQDSYSSKLAVVFMAAQDRAALVQQFEDCAERLRFEVDGRPITRGALTAEGS